MHHHEFAERLGRSDGCHHPARRRGVAVHLEVAAEHLAHGAGPGHPQQAHPPARAVLHEHGVAVEGQVAAHLAEVDRLGIRQRPRPARLDDEQCDTGGDEVDAALAHVVREREDGAVRRDVDGGDREVLGGAQHLALRSPVDGDRDDAVTQVAAPGLYLVGDAEQFGAVGRPGHAAPVRVAVSELRRLPGDDARPRLVERRRGRVERLGVGGGHVDDEQLRRAVEVPKAVRVPADAGDAARRFGRGIPPLDRAVATGLRHARGEGEAPSLGGEGEVGHSPGLVGDLDGLTAAGIDDEDLRAPPRVLAQEGDDGVIGRQPGRPIVHPAGETARRPRGEVDPPQLPHRPVGGEVRTRGREDRERSVGGDRGPTDPDQGFDVGRPHAHSPPNEPVSPTRRVLSAGTGSTAARATSAANSATL